MDTNSELAVQRALETATARRTTIIIAHKMSTVKSADQVIVLKQGEIVQIGTHQQLLQQRGSTYAKLMRLQELPSREYSNNQMMMI